MPKPSVYVETSVISYLVGWLNQRDLVVAHNQQFTREWWSQRRTAFDLFISPVVIDEASKGDPGLAVQRLTFMSDLAVLDVGLASRALSRDLVRRAGLPKKAELDALHIAIAAVNGMDYLVTWNCTHIANAVTLPDVYAVCRSNGYEPPFVCTPLELSG